MVEAVASTYQCIEILVIIVDHDDRTSYREGLVAYLDLDRASFLAAAFDLDRASFLAAAFDLGPVVPRLAALPYPAAAYLEEHLAAAFVAVAYPVAAFVVAALRQVRLEASLAAVVHLDAEHPAYQPVHPSLVLKQGCLFQN